jgi:predicted PurR-regulated permease PerM
MHRALATGPIVWLGIIVTTCLLLVIFQTVLWLVMPVLLAVVANYMLSPLVKLAMARGITRSRAVFIVTVLLTLLIVAIGFDVAPKVSSTVRDMPANIGKYAATANKLAVNARQTVSTYLPFLAPRKPVPAPSAPASEPPLPPADTLASGGPANTGAPATNPDDLQNQVADWQEKYSGDIAMELVRWIPSLLLVPYITYFFLLDGPRFKRFLVQAIPNAFFEKTLYLFYRVEDQMRRYFQGLLSLTALDALCLGCGLWFLGLNTPFFLAITAAIMAWLPYLGSIGGALLVALVAATDFPNNTWLPYEVLGLFVAVRLLDDFVFMPLTVGRSLHMHPLVTVLMILLGGAVAGISGLLLVMPVLGVVMVTGQIIGELLTDARILARHRYARHLRHMRARADLYVGEQ